MRTLHSHQINDHCQKHLWEMTHVEQPDNVSLIVKFRVLTSSASAVRNVRK